MAETFGKQAPGFFLPFFSFKFSDLRSRSAPKNSSLQSVLFLIDSVLSFALLISQAKVKFFSRLELYLDLCDSS